VNDSIENRRNENFLNASLDNNDLRLNSSGNSRKNAQNNLETQSAFKSKSLFNLNNEKESAKNQINSFPNGTRPNITLKFNIEKNSPNTNATSIADLNRDNSRNEISLKFNLFDDGNESFPSMKNFNTTDIAKVSNKDLNESNLQLDKDSKKSPVERQPNFNVSKKFDVLTLE
jgi:hypothetical protein